MSFLENRFAKRIITITVTSLLLFMAALQVHASEKVRIGGFQVIDVGGVEVLKDVSTGIINYYNAAATVAGCSGWSDEEIEASYRGTIGGINVKISEPGFYQFEYHLEPWAGKFAQLEGGQILLIKDLHLGGQSTVNADEVTHFKYAYEPSQKFLFNVGEPGMYTIGFGPYGGTLLPKSFVTDDAPNASSIRFALKRFRDATTLDESGFEFQKFVDLSYTKKEDDDYYSITPIQKGADYQYQPPGQDYKMALQGIANLTAQRNAWILNQHKLSATAGYSTVHPFGRDLSYAAKQVAEVGMALTDNDFQWNSAEIKDITAAKLGLYLWRLHERSADTQQQVNDFLSRGDYAELIEATRAVMEEKLPLEFPQFQMK